MSSLYPDESYCTSEVGRIIFHLKTDWACVGSVVAWEEEKHLTGSHTVYTVEIRCTPVASNLMDQPERTFELTTRYKEMSRLHSALAKLHKQLYLRGIFPSFPPTKLIGSSDPSVIQERRLAIDHVLNFTLDSEVLRKAKVLHDFVEKARERAHTAHEITAGEVFYDNRRSILDQPNGDSDSAELASSALTPSVDQSDESSADFQFPDVSIPRDNDGEPIEGRRKVSMKMLFPKLRAGNHTEMEEAPADYLVKAGQLVATAQRAEEEHAYELAFQCYKSAASSLIQGVQIENDMTKRNAVRRKTAKYLVKAEKLYRTYLSLDGSVFNFDGLLTAAMQDPNILAFQCSNKSMKNYRFVGVLPDLHQEKKVLLVEDIGTTKKFVMKLLEKGNPSTDSRIFLPTNIPHMVQLVQFFETETHIILLLEYVETGRLWDFMMKYFDGAESRYIMWLTELKADVRDGDKVEERTMLSRKKDKESYRGRRLLFTVGVDYERVVDMRDESMSSERPSEDELVCTIGEDPTGRSDSLTGDFTIAETSLEAVESQYFQVHEESPAAINLNFSYTTKGNRIESTPSTSTQKTSVIEEPVGAEAYQKKLAKALTTVRQQLGQRRRTWNYLDVPECLVAHWSAQIVSFLFVLHTEHVEFVGDLNSANILIDADGNLMITYIGNWYGSNQNKRLLDGYSAPESNQYGWVPTAESDIWTLGAMMFELLCGRSLANAAPHGVFRNMELPIPEDTIVSFVARDILNMILVPVPATRPSLDEIRSHPFFRHIDWSLYDNPSTPITPSASSIDNI